MEEKERPGLEKYVNLARYPLLNPGKQDWLEVVEAIRSDLDANGICVLPAFIQAGFIDQLQTQGEAIAFRAYDKPETVNAYNLPLDAPLSSDHPAKITMQRGNAFVARDLIPQDLIIHQLYKSEALLKFIAACFGFATLYRLADPLAGLCLNVLKPGCAHPWHFDINEFTVSLLTKQSERGGKFEYCPNIRSPEKENTETVRKVLTGRGEKLVRHLELQPGDLQLFKGRFALHRVSPVKGGTERHTAIFAYTPKPGVIGTIERTLQLFGRTVDAHNAAAQNRVRSDELLD